ncbi:MAG: TonB-dependent receptor [Spirosomaceae bacterium]|nr:TonB-dependent receptor [Spirosomataceae bacterium]
MKKSCPIPIGKFTLLILLFFISNSILAQKKISGKVTDGEAGIGLPGTTVTAKGTNKGTATDAEGNYSIEVPNGASVLVFSSIGYLSQEVSIGSKSVIDVALMTDSRALQEVVVTGYGSQAKKDITGAVATVDIKQALAVPSTNIAQAIQGRVAGVNVGNENAPGGGVMVRIRGFGTINDNSPLYIVDGTPTKGNLNTLNLNDIETMQVLKDASAASIYGSRAGNGVVIITTKKGKGGKPKFTYDAYYGQQTPIKFLDLLNTQEYANQIIKSRINAENNNLLVDGKISDPSKVVLPNIPMFGGRVNTPVIPDYIFPVGVVGTVDESRYSVNPKNLITRANKSGTDWFDEIFDSAPIQNHQVGVSGATESAQYAMSLNYFDQSGIMKYTSFKRYSLRANTVFNVNKKLRVGENMQIAYGEQIGQPNGNQSESNPISFAYRVPPITPVYDVRGYFAGSPTVLDNSRNPLAELWRNKDNKGKELRLFGNAFIEYDIIKDLSVKSQIGVDYNTFNIRRYRANDPESPEPVGSNVLTTVNSYEYTWTWSNTVNYNKTIGDNHRFNVIVGTESIKSLFEFFNAERSGFAVDDISNRYLSAGRAGINNAGGASEWRLASEFGKVNYAMKDRYLVDLTLRRDRSSRFAKQYRSALFPAASLGWVLTKESFLKELPWLGFAKLRIGYGQTGNQEIGNYNSFSTFSTSPESSFYDLAGARTSSLPGYELGQFGNANAKWETTTSTNIGLDANLFDNKLEVNFDWYNRITSDMLFPVEVQFTQGVAINPFQNIGEMQNKGIELGLNYNDKKNDFTYSIGVNFSTYRNTVLKTTGDPKTQYFGFSNLRLPTGTVSVTQQGYPLASFFGYQIDGIFQTDKEASEHPVQFGGGAMNKAGAFKFVDVNGDKVINAADRTIIGNPHPDFLYGVNASLGYKNFRLDIFGSGVQGNQLFNYVKYWTDFPTFGGNRSQTFYDKSWEPGKTDAVLPIMRSNDVISSNPSTYYIEDGSYFRLKNVQLTYTIPTKLTNKLGVGSASVYIQGQNLITITKYTGLDPEVNLRSYGSGSDRQIGVDEGSYPAFRSTNVGLSISF